jgi:uncharacterized membrane protein YdjX (TVP38/TMEM64 family)
MEGTNVANTVPTSGLRRLFHITRLVLFPLVIGAAAYIAWSLGYFDLEHRRRMVQLVGDFHSIPFAIPAFILFWAVVVSLALPSAIACTVGGAIFGTAAGAGLSWIAALLATVLAHTLSRRILRTPIVRLFGEHRLFRALRERADGMMLLRLRLMPLAPFATLDYVAGIVGVPMRRLLVATSIGVLPSVIAYSYVGAQIMASAQATGGAPRRALWIVVAVSAGMLLLSILPGLTGRKHE